MYKFERVNPNLEHLNIGSCVCIRSQANQVLAELGNCCKNLKSLDIWRLKNINEEGLACLYNNCQQLEELDAGWSTSLASETGCFVHLAKKCPQLRKIFLTANRTVRDCDIKAFADHCPHLQQLDILGTRAVTLEAITYILEKSICLNFLDVSFCVGITQTYTHELRATYPHVDIKRSFQDISSS
ncbi:hypothetical protein PoB_003257500 [Plakobranchus ocellatus]|uniref:Uncharacterized protein n=1 Tax=Plakobranchus ocellatus TaxID=259542 RepID=A0AAV4AD34_9GAST|nr:hypothetical protein PoB_003257500 [Plakobranchus ocellatus]